MILFRAVICVNCPEAPTLHYVSYRRDACEVYLSVTSLQLFRNMYAIASNSTIYIDEYPNEGKCKSQRYAHMCCNRLNAKVPSCYSFVSRYVRAFDSNLLKLQWYGISNGGPVGLISLLVEHIWSFVRCCNWHAYMYFCGVAKLLARFMVIRF